MRIPSSKIHAVLPGLVVTERSGDQVRHEALNNAAWDHAPERAVDVEAMQGQRHSSDDAIEGSLTTPINGCENAETQWYP